MRSLVARGEEPFEKIMQSISALLPGESLLLVTPFLPSPLIERLQANGFQARPQRRHDGSWETQFLRQ